MKNLLQFTFLRSTLLIIFTACFIIPSQSTAQEKEVFNLVESMPAYPGCENEKNEKKRQECTTEKILEFIRKKVTYPKEALDNSLEGKVFISYIVDIDGSITDVKVLKGVEKAEVLNEEALRVIALLPDHEPGVQDGEKVKVRYNIPINFALSKEDNPERQ